MEDKSTSVPDDGISVILPVFNGAMTFLGETIESILNQDFQALELIIVDDGSIDSTPAILARYLSLDQRIRLVTHETNRGICAALNHGLEEARFSLIARIDCGDVAEPTRLGKCHMFLTTHPECVLVSSQVTWINEGGTVLRRTAYPSDDKDIRNRLFIKDNIIVHPAVVFRKIEGLVYRHRAQTAEDYDLWLRLSLYGKMHILADSLVKVRYSSAGTTYSKKMQQIRTVDAIHENFIEYLLDNKQKDISSVHLNDLDTLQQRCFYWCTVRSEQSKNSFEYKVWKLCSLIAAPGYLMWLIRNMYSTMIVNKTIYDRYVSAVTDGIHENKDHKMH